VVLLLLSLEAEGGTLAFLKEQRANHEYGRSQGPTFHHSLAVEYSNAASVQPHRHCCHSTILVVTKCCISSLTASLAHLVVLHKAKAISTPVANIDFALLQTGFVGS
jgi:hypothetical protein